LQLADVSVVIPAYNAARLIVDTIRSVQAQSMADIEIIVVNDGSTDATLEVVRGFADRDPRIRIVSQENGGLAAARNAGLREARGNCVAFLDSDDIWHPDFLSEMYQALAGAPKAPFAYAYSFRFDIGNLLIPGTPWPYVPRHDFLGLLALNSVGNGSAAMFRRDALLRVGGYDASLRARGAQGAED
jgi:glycosyltransferase involved in cell wall biosynthesis